MTGRKILIITNRVPYPLNDGGNLAVHAMIEGYKLSGWQVYLLAMNTSRHSLRTDILDTLYKDIHAFEWMDINNDVKPVNIVRNYLFSKQAEHVERFYQKPFENKIIEIIKKFEPEVIQMESVYLTTYLPAIRHNSDAVKILRMHNIEYHIWHGLATKSKNNIRKKYFISLTDRLKNFEREAWKMYDLVLPITEKDAFHVRRLEKINDLIVAPFSMEMSNIPVRNSNERWVGYHLGAMDWIPNREGMRWFLDEVWPKIHNAIPKFEFYFAGRNMPAEFKEMNLDGVHCVENVEDANEFIADKKILIVPISSGGGIRVKILEAMAAGKVVITTPDGIKGIEGKAGEHYLMARKPEDFVRLVRWCLLNKEKAEALAENGRQLVSTKYEYSSVIKTVIDQIEILIKLRLE